MQTDDRLQSFEDLDSTSSQIFTLCSGGAAVLLYYAIATLL